MLETQTGCQGTCPKILPNKEWAKAVSPEVASNYVKERVMYWREGLHCFHQGFIVKDNKVHCQLMLHKFTNISSMVRKFHWYGITLSSMNTFSRPFTIIVLVLLRKQWTPSYSRFQLPAESH